MNKALLQDLQSQTFNHVTRLLSGIVKNASFGEALNSLIQSDHEDLIRKLESLEEEVRHIPGTHQQLQGIMTALRSIAKTASSLFEERRRQWHLNGEYVRSLSSEFHASVQALEKVLIEKDLLDRQSRVLSRIILSTEKVSQWKGFVLEILSDFQSMFPFEIFFVAFCEEHSLSLYLYYRNEPLEEVRETVRKQFVKEMFKRLHLPEDAPFEIEEFSISGEHHDFNVESLKTLTVLVPEYASDLSGILGLAYAFDRTLLPQEESILRSILSVMVMVIGSSKVISRTLSELEYYSTHDPLTGLHNRRYFNEIMHYEIGRSTRHEHTFSILSIDIDNFKDINDSYGHLCGDRTLIELSRIFLETIRNGDIVCRLGGDEFVILLPETSLPDGLLLAETLRRNVQETSFQNDRQKEFQITISVGVVSFPKDGDQIDDLLTGMDLVLYRAKSMGRNTVSLMQDLQTSVHTARLTRVHVEEFQQALREGRIVPHFHSIHESDSGKIMGYESLARFIKQDGTVMNAAGFMDLARKYALLTTLDHSVIRQSLQKLSGHLERLDRFELPRLFINLSSQEIEVHGFLDFARELCEQMGIPAGQIVFEITEREAIEDIAGMRTFLRELRKKGFSFALDDFGSGYNSFHYLRELYFDYVKIDGAFIQNLSHSRTDRRSSGT